MNAADLTCSKAKKKQLQQAAPPRPFAVRARPSARPITTGSHPANVARPNQPMALPIHTTLLPASLLGSCQP